MTNRLSVRYGLYQHMINTIPLLITNNNLDINGEIVEIGSITWLVVTTNSPLTKMAVTTELAI